MEYYIVIKNAKSMNGVLLRTSIAVKKCHDHGNSYKGKHFIGAGLQFQRFRTWQHAGRHGAREGAESSASSSAGSRRRLRATVGVA